MSRETRVAFPLQKLSDRLLQSLIKANLEGGRISHPLVVSLTRTLMREQRRRADGGKKPVEFTIPFLDPEENGLSRFNLWMDMNNFMNSELMQGHFTPLERTIAAMFCARLIHALEWQQRAVDHAISRPVN